MEIGFYIRAIPLKKEEGRKFSVTPLDKIGILSTPGQKRVFSLPPSDIKHFFTPLGHTFFL